MTLPPIANRYHPLRVLGQGAMGKVVLASDGSTGDEVAVKVIAGQVAEKSALQFRQEFRLMTQLRHQNCCEVADYGTLPDGVPYLTMEVVPGQGLDELLPIAGERFEAVLSQILHALGYIHSRGFVHCDLKAANVRVRPDGVVKLMDYGLMEYAGQVGDSLRGTLPYVSPEMVRRAPLDRRADLYSAGVLAYELLTGQLPFVRRSVAELLRAHVQELPPRPSAVASGVPPELDRLVMRLLAKEPVERFQSASEVLEALGFEAPPGIGGSLLGSPMVGREAELARCRERLQALLAGQPGGTLALHGPAGSGKSRLLDEFRCLVQLEHLPFAAGAAREHLQAPYGAVVEALRRLLPAMRQHVPDELAAAAPILVALLPELGVAPALATESPKNDMLRLQATLAGVLEALARRQPFVLALENWQWADAPSRDFVAYAERTLAGVPALLLLTTQEAGDPALAGLAPEALRRMVCNMLGTEQVAPGFVQAVMRLTGNNPAHVERLLEHLVKRGALARRDGRWQTELAWDAIALPATLDALVLERLGQLPVAARTLARAAAVLDAPARIELLGAIAGLDEVPLLEALEALQKRHMLVSNGDGAYVLAQRQDQEALYEQLGEAERRALHVAAARALAPEGLPAEQPTELVMAIATHATRGHEPALALPYNLEAGLRARDLYALADAEVFLAAGLALVPAADAALRLEYLLALGHVKRFSGQAAAALEHLEAAVALARTLPEPPAFGRLLTSLASVNQMLSRFDAALALGHEAVTACLAEGDVAGAARALTRIGRIQLFQNQADEALAAARRAVELATTGADPGILGLAYALAGYLIVTMPGAEVATGLAYLERAVALQQAAGDRIALNDAYNLLGNAHIALGNYPQARTAIEATLAISRENGLQSEICFALVTLATIAADVGTYREAAALAEQAVAQAQAIGARFPRGMALALQGQAAAGLGRLARADATMAEALALAREIGHRYLEAAVLARRVELWVELGQPERALATYAELEALVGEAEADDTARAWRVQAWLLLDRRAEADEVLAELQARADRKGARALLAQALLLQARRAMLGQDWATARRHAVAARGLAEGLGLVTRAAEVAGVQGEILLAQGQQGAAERFGAMHQLAEQAGAPALRAEACFGLAACAPYAPESKALADEGRDLLLDAAATLPEAERAAYLALPGRQRVLEGNFVAFGLPRERRKTGPLDGLGNKWGLL